MTSRLIPRTRLLGALALGLLAPLSVAHAEGAWAHAHPGVTR